MRRPRLTDLVLVCGPHARANGAEEAAGMVTRVWEEHPDGGWIVDLAVFPSSRTPGPAARVRLVESEEQARGLAPATAAWPAPGPVRQVGRNGR